jgi:MerR family transcriptional regulator, light-induced transcriptional regulator
MIKETDYLIYFDSLLKGEKCKCIETVNRLLGEGVGIKEIYFGLLQRTMYRIGKLWEKEKVSISSEKIATDITITVIGMLYPKVAETSKNGLKIVITCIDKEFHSLGPRMVADIFELNGWNSVFLGPCMPCNDVIESIKEFKPDVLGISSNFYMNLPRLIDLIEKVKAEFPKQEIITGGQIFSDGGSEILKKYKNVTYVSSSKMLEKYIKAANGRAAAKKKLKNNAGKRKLVR